MKLIVRSRTEKSARINYDVCSGCGTREGWQQYQIGYFSQMTEGSYAFEHAKGLHLVVFSDSEHGRAHMQGARHSPEAGGRWELTEVCCLVLSPLFPL